MITSAPTPKQIAYISSLADRAGYGGRDIDWQRAAQQLLGLTHRQMGRFSRQDASRLIDALRDQLD